MPDPAFTVEDFCKDPAFIHWVLNPSPESNRFWQAFIAEHPYKAVEIRLAVDFVKTIQFHEVSPAPTDLARLKHRIWAGLDGSAERSIRLVTWYQRPYRLAAAVALLVLVVGGGWWAYQATATLTYATAYGKIQELHLADGSVVTLNANSSLRVANNLKDSPVREVWLSGEAYFDIAKRLGAPFIVHTPEAQVRVLGTEFNVNTRRQQTSVVLHEGKVQLSSDNQSTVVMKPGDMATVVPRNRRIQLTHVQPASHDTWKESYLVLDGKSLPEIISILQDTFGVTIRLANEQLASKRLTGKLSTSVADDCIENLALILDTDVKKTGTTYSFK